MAQVATVPVEEKAMASNLFAQFRVGDQIEVFSATDGTNNGIYTLTIISDDFIGVTPAPQTALASDTTFTTVRDYSGTRTIAGVGDGFIELARPDRFRSAILADATIDLVAFPPISEWTDWFTQPSLVRAETWTNAIAPQGMYKDNGGKSATSVLIEWQVERLDTATLAPTGQVETFGMTLSGSVTDERGDTAEHATTWTGPARVRGRRVTPYDYDFEGNVIDEVKWVELYSVAPVDRANFGAVTTMQTVTLPTLRAISLRNRELNCLASRLLPIYDGFGGFSGSFDADGWLASGTIGPTSRMIDIIAAVSVDARIGNRAPGEVDLQQIYDVQTQLGDTRGQFNYTLDNDATSYEETIALIADACFCTAYRQSGRIRVYPDLPRLASVAQITHRNSDPKSQKITRTFSNESEYDGITLTYNDPDTLSSENIRLPADGTAVRPKKIEVPGIRSFAQAWYRAQREFRKLLGRRIAIEIDATLDGRVMIPGSRIDIVDNTGISRADGEVLAQNGLTLTLSQQVVFAPDQLHSIVLTRRNGSVEGIRCTQGADAYTVVLAYAPTEAIKTTNDGDGVRTIYSFAADNVRDSLAYTVQTIDPPRNGYVTVKAVNYSADFYAGDTEPLPDKFTVIN